MTQKTAKKNSDFSFVCDEILVLLFRKFSMVRGHALSQWIKNGKIVRKKCKWTSGWGSSLNHVATKGGRGGCEIDHVCPCGREGGFVKSTCVQFAFFLKKKVEIYNGLYTLYRSIDT